MTPKEKAKELMQKAYDLNQHNKTTQSRCKQIALLCVDEVISQWEYIDTYLSDLNGELNPNLKYWYDVKAEVSLL